MRIWLCLPLLLFACASTESAAEPVLQGRVSLAGTLPPAQGWDLDEAMTVVSGETEYLDETWLVQDGGVANCVVTLEPIGRKVAPAPPVEALYEKVGPRFEPRVLVVPIGSTVTLKNRNSPCIGFSSRTTRTSFNTMLTVGKTHAVEYPRVVYAPVVCDVRPYMKGAIIAVDTPYYAMTDLTGAFDIGPVPAGVYRLRVWHEGMTRQKAQKRNLVITAGETLAPLDIQLRGPRPKLNED